MSRLRNNGKAPSRSKAQDFDPEDDVFQRPQSDNESADVDEGSADEDAGRSHYESVGKSKLRKPQQAKFGPKYEGVAVSRKALEDVENDDPFAAVGEEDEDDPFASKIAQLSDSDNDEDGKRDFSDEDEDEDKDLAMDSDEAESGDGAVVKPKKRKTQQNPRRPTDDTDDDEQSESDLLDDDLNGFDDTDNKDSTGNSDEDMDDDEQEDDGSSVSSVAAPHPHKLANKETNSVREALRKAVQNSSSTAELASALSSSANIDIKKGQAVKKQRKTFDQLLDARIKLQKGVAAINELPTLLDIEDDEVADAAKSAEEAALKLWSTIDLIRCTILNTQNPPIDTKPTKRKRPLEPTKSTPLQQIWSHTQLLDTQSDPVNHRILEKWHHQTQPIQSSTTSRSSAPQQKSDLIALLSTYLKSQSATLLTTSFTPFPLTYTDTPFYQSLLHDLITSRSTTSLTCTTQPLPTRLHPPGSKTKKIDTKASKGRKIRYTVHEKLENFMAPEDRGTWTESARREFFGSLFGGAGMLREDGGEGGFEDEDEDDGVVEVEALKLFRS